MLWIEFLPIIHGILWQKSIGKSLMRCEDTMNFFKPKKTNELTGNEMSQICDLFYNVFNKEKKIYDFKRQFLNTHLGYSYHSIIEVDKRIVGINSIIPYRYNFFGNEKLFTLSVDTMIKKEYRSLPLFTQMTKAVYKLAQEDGVSLVFGFPNDG